MLRKQDKVDRNREAKFLGVGRISISSLEFDDGRPIDPLIIEKLKELYTNTSCRRYDASNYVPVLVTKIQLKALLRTSGKTQQDIKNLSSDGTLPWLSSKKRLLCPHGQHRVKAAEQFLPKADHWWTIEIYIIPSKGRTREQILSYFRYQFSHQTRFSDGEVYCNVRRFQAKNNDSEVSSWMSRLTNCKRISLKQLLKNEEIAELFDSLVQFPGLWAGLELGNIQKHLALRCDEAISTAHPIHMEKDNSGGSEIQKATDIQTVRLLELRVPQLSISDQNFVKSAMASGMLFPQITDIETRGKILRRLLRINCLIPSLKTMHENLKYLETGAKVLKSLKSLIITKTQRLTLNGALHQAWKNKSHESLVELPDKNIYVHVENNVLRWDLAYKQTWIWALRNFSELGGRAPRKELRRPLRTTKLDPSIYYAFAQFAKDMGISTKKITSRLRTDPKHEEVVRTISQIYPAYKMRDIENIAEGICDKLPASKNVIQHKSSESYLETSQILDLSRRCGVPFEKAYTMGKNNFYLYSLLKEKFVAEDEMPSPTFIFWDFIISFFGGISHSDIERLVNSKNSSDSGPSIPRGQHAEPPNGGDDYSESESDKESESDLADKRPMGSKIRGEEPLMSGGLAYDSDSEDIDGFHHNDEQGEFDSVDSSSGEEETPNERNYEAVINSGDDEEGLARPSNKNATRSDISGEEAPSTSKMMSSALVKSNIPKPSQVQNWRPGSSSYGKMDFATTKSPTPSSSDNSADEEQAETAHSADSLASPWNLSGEKQSPIPLNRNEHTTFKESVSYSNELARSPVPSIQNLNLEPILPPLPKRSPFAPRPWGFRRRPMFSGIYFRSREISRRESMFTSRTMDRGTIIKSLIPLDTQGFIDSSPGPVEAQRSPMPSVTNSREEPVDAFSTPGWAEVHRSPIPSVISIRRESADSYINLQEEVRISPISSIRSVKGKSVETLSTIGAAEAQRSPVTSLLNPERELTDNYTISIPPELRQSRRLSSINIRRASNSSYYIIGSTGARSPIPSVASLERGKINYRNSFQSGEAGRAVSIDDTASIGLFRSREWISSSDMQSSSPSIMDAPPNSDPVQREEISSFSYNIETVSAMTDTPMFDDHEVSGVLGDSADVPIRTDQDTSRQIPPGDQDEPSRTPQPDLEDRISVEEMEFDDDPRPSKAPAVDSTEINSPGTAMIREHNGLRFENRYIKFEDLETYMQLRTGWFFAVTKDLTRIERTSKSCNPIDFINVIKRQRHKATKDFYLCIKNEVVQMLMGKRKRSDQDIGMSPIGRKLQRIGSRIQLPEPRPPSFPRFGKNIRPPSHANTSHPQNEVHNEPKRPAPMPPQSFVEVGSLRDAQVESSNAQHLRQPQPVNEDTRSD
ncbi:hypothetical protein ACMFMG_011986 [Clarireedia jacksonii]